MKHNALASKLSSTSLLLKRTKSRGDESSPREYDELLFLTYDNNSDLFTKPYNIGKYLSVI